MELLDQDIAEFQNIYKVLFGKKISRDDAHMKGLEVLRLVSLAYKPITQEQFTKFNEKSTKKI